MSTAHEPRPILAPPRLLRSPIRSEVSDDPQKASADRHRDAPIDALRGSALALMALRHAGYLAHLDVIVERSTALPARGVTGLGWWLGIITVASGSLFWFLGGVAISYFARQRSAERVSGRGPTWHLLSRGAVLVALNFAVMGVVWARPGEGYTLAFDALASLGVGVMLMALLRHLPFPGVLALTAALVFLHPLILAAIPLEAGTSGALWRAVWLHPTIATRPIVWYPVLGWFGVMALGYAFAECVGRERLRRARTWAWLGGVSLAAWPLLRLAGPYGNLTAEPVTWATWSAMTVQPVSLAYLGFSLGIGGLAGAALTAARPHLCEWPLRGAVALGRAPVFFFVAHCVVLQALVWMARLLPGRVDVPLAALLWLISLVVLVPACEWFRRVRNRHPRSLLRFV